MRHAEGSLAAARGKTGPDELSAFAAGAIPRRLLSLIFMPSGYSIPLILAGDTPCNAMRYETSQTGRVDSPRLDDRTLSELRSYFEKNRLSDSAETGMCICEPPAGLSAYLANKGLPFSRLLLQTIRDRGLEEVEVYKRAHIDRKLFSKIRSRADYQPKKATVIAFALALRLSLAETQTLLSSAGYALSAGSPFDLIICFFIERGEYDFFRINDALYEFNQPILAM